ncbi:MmgE/PrpD family protein [Pollutimonas bauzanensis]|uniref:2-methylcitrate dehydratase PrpD n=1 Tax=Pollutimonas bauzanensis TaxID=658167 RepID=A0A1M5YYS9_9BURK|nr:MmgE/PrpD family protein [Pollutimonas bauzanensis]SHI17100.1 2-methylcitrate dehydratase PrpD [Pollutimonas bauzanensis]
MLIEQLSAYGAQDARRRLPDAVMHHAKRAVLDWFGSLYPGTRVAPCLQLMRAHRSELGVGNSSLPGNGATAFAATAAWINGSASHAVEFDDIFRDAVYHPGCPTISAALAVAEDRDLSGLALLNAVVVGYEISTRVGAAVQPAHYRYFHTTGTVGCLGAAGAAAALLAPGDAATMQHALTTAATFASGLQQAFRSDAMTKALHAGHAAAVGVRAGQAAAHGVTGVPDILEGEVGFGAALAQSPDWAVAVDELGQRYNITQITQKNHGCCGHTFAAIDAALLLRSEHRIAAAEIARIEVSTYKTAIDVTGNFNPGTAFEGKFSLPYVLAHALIHGSVRLDAFEPERLADPRIRALMSRLALEEDPALTAGFPRQRAANVNIILKNGQSHAHFSPYRKGDPESPLSDAELNDKFDELAGPVLGRAAAQALRKQIWRLDTLTARQLDLARL